MLKRVLLLLLSLWRLVKSSFARNEIVPNWSEKSDRLFRQTKELAEQGDAQAQFDLAVLYETGDGILQSYKEAAKWFQKAAEQGVFEAQYNLAKMYEEGRGVEQNYQEAKKWYGKVCDNGEQKGCDEYARLTKAGY